MPSSSASGPVRHRYNSADALAQAAAKSNSSDTITDPQTCAKHTLEYEGKDVINKLNGERLRKVAIVTEGACIPAGTSALELLRRRTSIRVRDS